MTDDKDKKKQMPRRPAGGVFDVRRPGRAPASPTSRPVILGHKPEAEAAQAAVSGVGEASPMLTRRKIQIMPSGDIQAVSVGTANKEEEGFTEPTEPEPRDIPEEDKEALAAAAIDAVNGPPELPEQKQGPESEEEPSGESEDRSMVFTKPKLVIEPPSEAKEPEPETEEAQPAETKSEPEEAPTPDKTEAEGPEESEKAEEPEEAEEAKPEEAAPAAAESSVGPSATEESVPGEDEQKAKPEGEEQDGMPKPEPHIEPLFDEHGIIVSHHDHGRRNGSSLKVLLLVLLILFLAVVALDVLLDLEILKLNDIPHTDLL